MAASMADLVAAMDGGSAGSPSPSSSEEGGGRRGRGGGCGGRGGRRIWGRRRGVRLAVAVGEEGNRGWEGEAEFGRVWV